ncbi:MAG: DEAD/DEAH box helicase, partial [Nanoarchaeota archaeon]|nr:DEAD/DEAH box helicase [Nanoarchaeota archaeon]
SALHPRVMALTASPGSDQQKIDEIVMNLGIEKIEYRKPDDKEITEFTAGTSLYWEQVTLPESFSRIISYLQKAFKEKLQEIKQLGFLSRPSDSLTKSQLLQLQQQLHARVVKGEKTVEILQSISIIAQAVKLSHAIELAESQTLFSLHEYLFGILKQSKTTRTKAIKQLAIDPLFLSALSLTRDLLKEKVEHPKIAALHRGVADLIKRKPSAKMIIFTQYRHTAQTIKEHLKGISGELFFGQAKKDGVGLSQKEQQAVLDRFRKGEFSCLLATSVAEEGLDIPSVDHVFFYEPVPSAIRSVQRRGRTGRHQKGFVTILVAKGTRDETFRWIAHHKEKRMYEVLNDLSTKPSSKPQMSLDDFKKEKPEVKIVGDFREKGSPVLKTLHNLPVDLELKQLAVGDFVLSKECCVEYKNFPDFVDSIIDGRLLSQLRSLSQYTKPVVIIEGEAQVHRKIDPAAVSGMLSTIALSYRIPVLRTFSPLETANLLFALARHEQEESKEAFTFHTAKPLDQQQLLEYVVSSFPSVGGTLARSLLDRFDTIENISKASLEELKAIPLIGEKKALEIKKIFSTSYREAKDDAYRS